MNCRKECYKRLEERKKKEKNNDGRKEKGWRTKESKRRLMGNDSRLFSSQVLVTPLMERGFLLLLSSVQMATPTGMTWETRGALVTYVEDNA